MRRILSRGNPAQPLGRVGVQVSVPTRAPIPAVTAMAIAPQTTTRIVARSPGAPPSRAPTLPSKARAISVTVTVATSRTDAGTKITANSGNAAPAENDSADAHAA